MRLELHLSLDTAAFAGDDGDHEVADILGELAAQVRTCGYTADEPVRLRDSNGNRCGYAVFTESPVQTA